MLEELSKYIVADMGYDSLVTSVVDTIKNDGKDVYKRQVHPPVPDVSAGHAEGVSFADRMNLVL